LINRKVKFTFIFLSGIGVLRCDLNNMLVINTYVSNKNSML